MTLRTFPFVSGVVDIRIVDVAPLTMWPDSGLRYRSGFSIVASGLIECLDNSHVGCGFRRRISWHLVIQYAIRKVFHH